MPKKPILSIVIEAGTREVTGNLSLEKAVRAYRAEAKRSLSEAQFEIILVGSNLPQDLQVPGQFKALDLRDRGYYGWKNAGARAARGRYMAFWDSDCRPSRGYLQRAVEVLESDPKLFGITGVSRYNKTSFLGRLNTVLSFGFLYQGKPSVAPYSAMAHNMVLRKSAFPKDPFGPFNGRMGGDEFLSKHAAAGGYPLRIVPDIWISHEDHDPIYSVTNFYERHSREIFHGLLYQPARSKLTAFKVAATALGYLPVRRLWRVFKYGKRMGFGLLDALLSIPILVIYAFLDLLMVLILAFRLDWLDRLLHFQLGSLWPLREGSR